MQRCHYRCRNYKGMVDKMAKGKHRHSDGKEKRIGGGGPGRAGRNCLGQTFRASVHSISADGQWRTTLLRGPERAVRQLCQEAIGRNGYAREWWVRFRAAEPTSKWQALYLADNCLLSYRAYNHSPALA